MQFMDMFKISIQDVLDHGSEWEYQACTQRGYSASSEIRVFIVVCSIGNLSLKTFD